MKYLLIALCGIILCSCRKEIKSTVEDAKVDGAIFFGDSYTGPPGPIDSAFLLILIECYPELK